MGEGNGDGGVRAAVAKGGGPCCLVVEVEEDDAWLWLLLT